MTRATHSAREQAESDSNQQTGTRGQGDRFERLALHAMGGVVSKILEPLDTMPHSPQETFCRVSTFFARISGH